MHQDALLAHETVAVLGIRAALVGHTAGAGDRRTAAAAPAVFAEEILS